MTPIISDKEILILFNQADNNGKRILEKVMGKEPFEIDFASVITTFEDGLKFKSLTADDVLPIVPTYMKELGLESKIHAVSKLIFLRNIYVNGWEADYSNSRQRKFWPWHTWSGSGLSLIDVGYGRSSAGVAACLTFPNEKMAKDFERNFNSIYNDWLQ